MKSRMSGESRDIMSRGYLCLRTCLSLKEIWLVYRERMSLFIVVAITGCKHFFLPTVSMCLATGEMCTQCLAMTGAHKACLEPYQIC